MHHVKIGLISLGCPKNLVDSQNLLTLLMKERYQISSSYEDADIVVVNTCGFIESAVDESLETIGEALNYCNNVVVTGCLGPRRDLILSTYPQVKAITGPHSAKAVVDEIKKIVSVAVNAPCIHVPKGGVLLTPNHYAYLKISEGCSHKCSFCIIPKLRGPLESFEAEKIIETAKAYVERGVKELIVVAQDTSAYGMDVKYKPFMDYERGDLYALTRELGKLGVWQRVHYSYPYLHVEKLVEQMAEGLVLPYMDIPMQHVSQNVLRLMKRPGSQAGHLDMIKRYRSICPDLTIRSTFIVGFPGETEQDFEELLEFIEEAKLDRVGCFTYSSVFGADANELPNQVDEEVKLERLDRFMLLQQKISTEKLAKKVSTVQDVIIDEIREEGLVGRTKGDAPEIDGVVYVNNESNKSIKVGDIVKVCITASDEYDLEGDVI